MFRFDVLLRDGDCSILDDNQIVSNARMQKQGRGGDGGVEVEGRDVLKWGFDAGWDGRIYV